MLMNTSPLLLGTATLRSWRKALGERWRQVLAKVLRAMGERAGAG